MAVTGGLDLATLTAIDVHVHVESDGHGHCALDDELLDASAAYFRSSENRTPTVADIAAHYRARGVAAVVFTVDAEGATGHPALSSEQIADEAAAHVDVLIPFGSVDPTRGAEAVRRARRLVTEHGVRGFKFHPSLQGFAPNDPAHYPLYEALQELGVPALFHTGQTGIGAGLPGEPRLRADPDLACGLAVPTVERRRAGLRVRVALAPRSIRSRSQTETGSSSSSGASSSARRRCTTDRESTPTRRPPSSTGARSTSASSSCR